MGDPGRYLSSLADYYLKARGLAETERRGDVYEAHEAFRIKDYLDGLEQEKQAQGTLATILRNRQQQPRPPGGMMIPPPPPGMPPGPPPGVSVEPTAPPGMSEDPQMGQPAMAPPAAVMAPSPMGSPMARPPMQDSIMQGISPEAQAQFMTTQTGKSTWPSIEAAERERRRAEDFERAEGFMTKATEAVKANDPTGFVDNMAAFYRNTGQHDKAAGMMERSVKLRTDDFEKENAPKEFAAIYGTIQAWETDPTPAKFTAIVEAMSGAKTMSAKVFSLEAMKNAIGKKLSQDPDENAMLVHVATQTQLNKQSVDDAWASAIQKYPSGAVKMWQRALVAPDKTKLPTAFYKAMRIEEPLPFKGDEKIGQRAFGIALREAQAGGFANDPLKFTRRWNEIEAEMIAAEKKSAVAADPAKAEKEKLDLEHARTRAKKDKQDLEKGALDIEGKKARNAKAARIEELKKNPSLATPQEISLEIDRLNRDLRADNFASEEERSESQEALTFYRGLRAKKQAEMGGPPVKEPGSPEARKKKALAAMKRLFPRKRPQDLTPEEKQKVMDAIAE